MLKVCDDAVAMESVDHYWAYIDAYRRELALGGDAEVGRANWYVVHLVAGTEKMVKAEMDLFGINSVLLTHKEKRTSHRRRSGNKPTLRDVDVATFPGYIFVRCPFAASSWHAVMSFNGVFEILGNDSGPVLMTDEHMGELILRMEGQALDFSTGRFKFEAGDKVSITSQNMANVQGVVGESYGGTGIVPILVDAFGRKIIVMVSVDHLVKID